MGAALVGALLLGGTAWGAVPVLHNQVVCDLRREASSLYSFICERGVE